jgi:hypothetical protein
MTRWISLTFFLLALLSQVRAQDVFDLENSRRFAAYLYDSGQYDLAADEFERVVFLAPDDSLSILRLLQAYRMGKQYDIGLKRATGLFPETRDLELKFFRELYLLHAYLDEHRANLALIRQNETLSTGQKNRLEMGTLLLDRDWETAAAFYEQHAAEGEEWTDFNRLLDKRNELQKKNPYLAAGFSLVIPGSGKVYTKNWQDGLISLLFVATNAWQAYRGFRQDGVRSVYGWVFGSIGAGFWLGNVYGSYKAGVKYNERIENEYYEEVRNTVYRRF